MAGSVRAVLPGLRKNQQTTALARDCHRFIDRHICCVCCDVGIVAQCLGVLPRSRASVGTRNWWHHCNIAALGARRFVAAGLGSFGTRSHLDHRVLGTSLVIAGNTVHPTGTVGRILSIRVLVQMGLVSYAWYLWHWPALSIARILDAGRQDLLRDCAISASTLALFFVTLELFERPLRFHLGGSLPARWGCGHRLWCNPRRFVTCTQP